MYKMLREDLDYIARWISDKPETFAGKTFFSKVEDLLKHYIELEKEAPQCFEGEEPDPIMAQDSPIKPQPKVNSGNITAVDNGFTVSLFTNLQCCKL